MKLLILQKVKKITFLYYIENIFQFLVRAQSRRVCQPEHGFSSGWERGIGSGGDCWSFNKTIVLMPGVMTHLCHGLPTFSNNS